MSSLTVKLNIAILFLLIALRWLSLALAVLGLVRSNDSLILFAIFLMVFTLPANMEDDPQ